MKKPGKPGFIHAAEIAATIFAASLTTKGS
jgi:hypothetical protein